MDCVNLNQNTGSYAFLDTNLVSVFRQPSGQDVTKPLNAVLNSMTAANRQCHLACLNNAFLAGKADFIIILGRQGGLKSRITF